MKLMANLEIVLVVNVCFVLFGQCQASVLLSYQTDYPDGDRYFILDNNNLILTCSFDVIVYEVTWSVDGTTAIYSTNTGKRDTEYKDRILDYSSTDTEHRLTLLIDRNNDLWREITCEVRLGLTEFEKDEIYLNEILLPPDEVTFQDIHTIISGKQHSLICITSSIYKGAAETIIKIKSGDSYVSSTGTTTQSKDSDKNVYTVTSTHLVTLTYSEHQTLEVQCVLTWMGGTSVEVTLTSGVKTLDIFFPASFVDTEVTDASLAAGESLTLTCTTFSNPSPRLRLYRQREGGTTSVLHSVIDVTLTHTLTVEAAENKAGFYCRVDDNNNNIAGWEFDVLSEILEVTVWYQPSITYLANTSPNPEEGETREMTCSSTSAHPGPVLTLYRGDVEVKSVTGTQLSHTVNIRREINGVNFKCVATSSSPSDYTYNLEEGDRFYIVLYKASTLALTEDPGGIVKENTEMLVTCTTGEGNPVPKVRWYRDSETVPVDTSRESVINHIQSEDTQYNGLIRQSTLTIRAHRSLNGKQYRCQVEGTSLEKYFRLMVSYAPITTVVSIPMVAEEGKQLQIICEIEDGNPPTLSYLYLEFQPKYKTLPKYYSNRQVMIENVSHLDAGVYRCIAGNEIENTTSEKLVNVNFQPTLISPETTDVVFVEMYQTAELILTVRAFPIKPDVQSMFTWSRATGTLLTNSKVTSSVHENDVVKSTMIIDPVEAGNYGQYNILVDNNFKDPVSFTLELRPKGPPNPATEVSLKAISAEKVMINWRAGLDGGSQQYFKIILRKVDSNAESVLNTEHVNTSPGNILHYIVEDLTPRTEYILNVLSINVYGEENSPSVYFRTRAKPVVKQEDLKVTFEESYAKLSWAVKIEDTESTTVIIEQCASHETCIKHNVTATAPALLNVSVSEGNIFYLVVYQDGLEAYRSDEFIKKYAGSEVKEHSTTTSKTSQLAGIVSGVTVGGILLIIISIATVFLVLRRTKNTQKQSSDEAKTAEYVNVDPKDTTYQELDKKNVSETSLYQDLENTTQ